MKEWQVMDGGEIQFVGARHDDLQSVTDFLQFFMDGHQLLPRTSIELELLLKHAFIARSDERIVGFAALEIYSKKLAEIQCLAVSDKFRRRGVGRTLVSMCVGRAREQKVVELMAISNSDKMFQACGFDYSLPNQKRAFFIQPLAGDEG
jgi:amino-acid N-acetyltransferase